MIHAFAFLQLLPTMVVVALTALTSAAPAVAAPLVGPAAPPSGDPLPLLFAEAWEQSPTVLRARANLEAARGERARAGVVLPNPQLSAGVMTDVLTGNDGELDVDLGLQQELHWPGGWLHRMEAADASIDSALAQLALARLAVAADVEEAVATAVAAREARAAWDALADVGRRMNDAAAQRLAAGAIGPLEAALADADAAVLEARAVIARARAIEAATALCQTLARATCEDAATDPALDAMLAAVAVASRLLDVDAAAHQAERADGRAAGLAESAARARLAAAELQWLPTARLGLGATYETLVLPIPGQSRPVIDRDWMVGAQLSVTLPVWDWRTQDVRAARSGLMDAEAQVREVRVTGRSSARAAQANFEAASAAAARLHAVQPRIVTALADVEHAWASGAVPLNEALVMRDRLLQARLSGIDAARARMVAHAALLRALAQPAVVGIGRDGGLDDDVPFEQATKRRKEAP